MIETAREVINKDRLLHLGDKNVLKRMLMMDQIVTKFKYGEKKEKEAEEVFEMTKNLLPESNNSEEDTK